MADEFRANIGSGNWWDSSRNSDQFDSGSSSSTSTTSIGSFGWPITTDMVDMNKAARSCTDSISVSCNSMVFQETPKLQESDPNLQMMGLGLSTQAVDWNQDLLRGGKIDNSYHSLIQEDHLSSNVNFQQEIQWRGKMFPSMRGEECSTNQVGFSIDQPQYSSSNDNTTVTCQGLSSNFQIDNNSSPPSVYGENPSSILVQGLFESNNNQPFFENRSMSYNHPYASNYSLRTGVVPSKSLNNKFPQLLRSSPSKPPCNTQFQFSNCAHASAVAGPDVTSGFLPSMEPQFPACSTFDQKPKNTKVRDSATGQLGKKNGSEVPTKRPRSETQSALPPFKVRKEKMGDRVTALQQLVSPFGKTDTASVLSEAIEYIKFLHEQVSNYNKSREPEGPNKDLRSRGLCLVPVSSTFPVTHETTVDFWTPTFGGSFR